MANYFETLARQHYLELNSKAGRLESIFLLLLLYF